MARLGGGVVVGAFVHAWRVVLHPGGPIARVLRARTTPLLAALAVGGSGCLWIPGMFPEKLDPPPPATDNRPLSHCSPHIGEPRPVLLGVQTGERTFACRIKEPEQAEWTVSFPEPLNVALPPVAIAPYVLAQGLEALTLSAADLPWSPQPYEALLELRLREDGETVLWRVIVLPHPDDAFPIAVDGGQG